MSGLIDKGVAQPTLSPMPAARNRLTATFSPLPEGDFALLAPTIQPIMQSAGFAPEIYIRTPSDPFRLSRQTVNYSGPYDVLAFSVQLFLAQERRSITTMEIDSFQKIVEQTSDAITEFMNPKGWFAKRKTQTSGIMVRPCMAAYDKNPADAIALGNKYENFLRKLPPYQKHVHAEVLNVAIEADEVQDFADFAGFPPSHQPNIWYHPQYSAAMILQEGKMTISILSVPRCFQPDAVFQNILEIGRRFVMEFGGNLNVDERLGKQVITGWRNVLAPQGFACGDEEVRAFFLSPITMQA